MIKYITHLFALTVTLGQSFNGIPFSQAVDINDAKADLYHYKDLSDILSTGVNNQTQELSGNANDIADKINVIQTLTSESSAYVGAVLAIPENFNKTDVAEVKQGFESLRSFLATYEKDAQLAVNQSMSTHCAQKYATAYSTLTQASNLFSQGKFDDFHRFCYQQGAGKGTICQEALHNMTFFIFEQKNDYYCNLTYDLYKKSLYKGVNFKGMRDRYMRVAAYIQQVTNLAIAVQSAWQVLETNNMKDWLSVQIEFELQMQNSMESIVWFNEYGKKNSLANMKNNTLTVYNEFWLQQHGQESKCPKPLDLTKCTADILAELDSGYKYLVIYFEESQVQKELHWDYEFDHSQAIIHEIPDQKHKVINLIVAKIESNIEANLNQGIRNILIDCIHSENAIDKMNFSYEIWREYPGNIAGIFVGNTELNPGQKYATSFETNHIAYGKATSICIAWGYDGCCKPKKHFWQENIQKFDGPMIQDLSNSSFLQ